MKNKRLIVSLVLIASFMALAACNAGAAPATVVPTGAGSNGSLPTAAVPSSYPAPTTVPEVGVAYPSVGQLPTPTVSGYPAGGAETLQSPQSVTLEDSGKTVMLKVGDRFLLNLGMDVYQWSLNIDDQTVLSRVKNIMTIKGSQGLFEALKAGRATLTASGDPLCASAVPACKMPSRLFTINVVVQ
jgi:hypothetical protein